MCRQVAGSGIPQQTFELCKHAWHEFEQDPSSWQTFEALDLLIQMLCAKWAKYSAERFCAAGAAWSREIAPLSGETEPESTRRRNHGLEK